MRRFTCDRSGVGGHRRGGLVLLVCLCGTLVLAGCQSRTASRSEQADTASTPEGWSAIACNDAGDLRSRSDRQVVRGRVLLPVFEGASATNDAGTTSNDARPSETRPPRRRERPARGATIEIYRRDSPDDVLVSTQTNASGDWCVSAPGDAELGVELLARAEASRGRLRRPIVTPLRQIVSVRSEALVRLLEERPRLWGRLSRAGYLNLQAIASTAVDLLDPVQWQHVESLDVVARRMEETMAADRRLQAELERLSGDVSTSDTGTSTEAPDGR